MIRSIGAALLAAVTLGIAPAAAQIPGLGNAGRILDRVPSLSSFLEGDPPITTSLDDARTEIAFLDVWSPRGWKRLDGLPRTDQGAFRLRPGLYALEAQSYCMHAGTHGPGHAGSGDGYLYAPLAGPKAPIIQSILRNSVAHPEIPQRDIQVLIWAIIARTEFDEMPRETQQTARALLSRDEVKELGKGALGLVPESVMREAMSRLPPVARQVFQAEAELRSRLSSGVSSYQELERIAVLTGDPPPDPDSRLVPEVRWSFDPAGYFVRYDPSGYSRTRVEVSVPRPVAIARDASGRIVGIYGPYGRRLEMAGGGLRLVGPGGGAGRTVLSATPSAAGNSPASAVLSVVLGSRRAPADAMRDLAEIEGLARAVRASGRAVGDGVSAPGGAAAVPSANAGALDLLVEAWQATFCLAAGCPTTPAGEDVLVLRSGATVRGALAWCGADVCRLGRSNFPLEDIEWIGLAAPGGPPAAENPGLGEVHRDDGSVRVGDLVSLGERFVVTDGGGHQRPDVAWIHVVPGEEDEEEEPPFVGGAPDGGAPDGGVTPPAGGGQGQGGGQQFDGPVYDPSDDVATPGHRGFQRLAQSGVPSGDPPDEEEDDCADERRAVERAWAQVEEHQARAIALSQAIQSTPGVGQDWDQTGYTGPAEDLARQWRLNDAEFTLALERWSEATGILAECEGTGGGEGTDPSDCEVGGPCPACDAVLQNYYDTQERLHQYEEQYGTSSMVDCGDGSDCLHYEFDADEQAEYDRLQNENYEAIDRVMECRERARGGGAVG